MDVSKEKLLEMYEIMVKIRKFEEKCAEVSLLGELPSYPHLCIGQEASIAGVCANLREDDYITSTHRGHGHNIGKGGDLKRLMAEIYGKATGYNKGKAGTMHLCAWDKNVVITWSVVGDPIPVAVGVGLSIKLRGTDQVIACFFGDGATNTGAFHEGVNLAAVWKLPVIFVCENNLYAVTTKIDKTTVIDRLSKRAIAYGIPGVTVDGNDAIAVYKAAKEAVERARRGEGPTLLECLTYRWRGSSEGDPNRGLTYRPKEEVEEWMKKCPIKKLKTYLIENDIVSEAELAEIEMKIEMEVEEAVKFARESPYPDVKEALTDLWAEEVI